MTVGAVDVAVVVVVDGVGGVVDDATTGGGVGAVIASLDLAVLLSLISPSLDAHDGTAISVCTSVSAGAAGGVSAAAVVDGVMLDVVVVDAVTLLALCVPLPLGALCACAVLLVVGAVCAAAALLASA
jgi:hypothetical protein